MLSLGAFRRSGSTRLLQVLREPTALMQLEMDNEYEQFFNENHSADHVHVNASLIRHSDQPDAQCLVCRRAFSLEAEVSDGFEPVSICRQCKIIVLDDIDTSVATRDFGRGRRQRARERFGSSESIEDLFSQQFSELISLARQNHEEQVDSDATATLRQRSSHNTPHSRSRRWRRTYSDTDSDVHMDSLFGESDSNISYGGYGGYGGESDASVDGRSILDREILVQLDHGGYTDTDIDPMHAGLDQWNSDEEDGEWEEAYMNEVIASAATQGGSRDVDNRTAGSNGRGRQDGRLARWLMGGNRRRYFVDIFPELEGPEAPPYVGNPGDYLDGRGLEELLEQLAETEGSRRGAPPAATSFVGKLPFVIITMDHEKNGSVVCPICKDQLTINSKAKQLPCMHLYHPSCILPWLSARNTCPVCRYELPTDDLEYENGKRSMTRTGVHEIQGHEPAEESSSDASSEIVEIDTHDVSHRSVEQGGAVGSGHVEDRSSRGGGRWLFLAAAPVVSIVGMVLVMWFKNPLAHRRLHNNREREHHQLHSAQSTLAPLNTGRRWWLPF